MWLMERPLLMFVTYELLDYVVEALAKANRVPRVGCFESNDCTSAFKFLNSLQVVA
jgi:hypothetical protein